eukprot:CAMPEP_0185576258 /NCGR_PEP_ID=MMETSP0434-20130131/7220_1 /TAXON_ID=626734 ORGANISM="Favella taraikaensis, Strain Fe Narragansett Bay" /NCGR_SAMPLE_ID=MMETSP0434 /ASSEMBLY_ACC=CAM_ASM_000379 /LENGTH=95 /DNA_ID=CAMNT_0028193377 /DNA_START=869 /DNA_END=1156 /DNA_ORIENTATION=+
MEMSEVQSEADILRGMAATMRASQTLSKVQSKSHQYMEIEAGGNVVQENSGALYMTGPSELLGPMQPSVEYQDPLNAMKNVKSPKELIKALWSMS